MELERQQLLIGGHSMVFFLVLTMRTMQDMQPEKIKVTWKDTDKKPVIAGAFNMDDVERFAAAMPEEILPPYRKNRSYINSVLAGNEVGRYDHPGCKMAFTRVRRGLYILTPEIRWESMI